MQKRGIIITPEIKTLAGGGIFIKSSEITPEQLRLSLLFWDEIDWPDNNIISIGSSSQDLDFLSQCGIFNRTKVNFQNFQNEANLMLTMQDMVLKEKNRLNPGLWSIERIGNDLTAIQGITHMSKSIEFELYNAIPIPHKDVPFNDILEFKEKYRSDLIALRSVLDEMYLNIIKSPDPILAKNVALTRLSGAISDVHKAMQSQSIIRSLTSYKIVLNNFNDIWDTVTRGYGAYELTQGFLGNNLSLLAGGANAMFKISAKENNMSIGLPKELKDYAYLAKIEREII
jgi:hypothetical protein